MMPPPFLPLYDLFRTQRRRSACCSCPGDSASRDQAPCCHSDHKVWVCAAAPLFMKAWRSSPLGGVACWHRHRCSSAAATYGLFLAKPPHVLSRPQTFSAAAPKHKDGSSLKSSCGTEDASRGGFLFLFIIPSGGRGAWGGGGGYSIPVEEGYRPQEKNERKKSTYALLMF